MSQIFVLMMTAAPLRTLAAALCCAGVLSACSVAPVYEVPSTPAPASFKEAGALWQSAQPNDALDRGEWWQLFADEQLNRLAAQVQVNNQNIAAAVAAVAQAQAALRSEQAGLLPSVSGSLGQTRQGGGQANGNGSASIGINASWDADLWGRLRESVSAAQSSAQASEADLAAARLSAVGSLVQNYFKLREADAELQILQQSIDGYQRSLQIVQNRYNVGVEAKTAVLQAQTTLTNTQASLESTRQARQSYEHAIAVLTGQAPAQFSLPAVPWQVTLPQVPLVVPSTLLERRPDIAAAERAVAAANAQIGVAQAAYYPSLNLSGSLNRSGSNLGNLFSASGLLWSLGASLGQSIFNGGATAAQVDAAKAAHAAKTATYRQTVLSAFQAVEDGLSNSMALAAQRPLLQQSLESAQQVEQQMLNRYQAGQVQYTEVVTAQATALNARRSLIQLELNQQLAAAQLVQELGGGWHAPWLAQQTQP
ncbi:efflux transporter outer membrane subunit [Comamonas sp. J-3]|uniref:efflux transporter outer membrane subunit n=1 Tax=Comamonas trifloxystrobinivorans TaxID=3350256 RepID=UPI003729137D